MRLFDFFKRPDASTSAKDKETNVPTTSFGDIIVAIKKEMDEHKRPSFYIAPTEYNAYKKLLLPLDDKQKVNFILTAIPIIENENENNRINAFYVNAWTALMIQVLKGKLNLDEKDILSIIQSFSSHNVYRHSPGILHWPISPLMTQVEKFLKDSPLSDPLRKMLLDLKGKLPQVPTFFQGKEQVKLKDRIDTILFQSDNKDATAVKPTFFPVNDEFGLYANKILEEKNSNTWYKLMAACKKASGGKPTKKFLDETKQIIQEISPEQYKITAHDWFNFIIQLKENDRYDLISTTNVDMLKGFIWTSSHLDDIPTLNMTAAIAERAYKKIPGKGPGAPAIGNACFYTLAISKGLDGVGHLSRLKLRIKQSNVHTLIEKYIREAATTEGVTVHEIEDMAVGDYGLIDGKRIYELEGYKATLAITGVGKTTLQWSKPDGTPQKSIPATVKENRLAELKAIKETTKQLEITLTAQRDRLDRLFKAGRKIDGEKFDTFFFSHGLMSWLTKRLIWEIDNIPLFFYDGAWVNAKKERVIDIIAPTAQVTLWHPINSPITDITAWRDFMLANTIIQPLKQAFREIYLLTDAEINTRVYSNRMAAHILKQHQFNSLAKGRGWKYSLMGGYDNGIDRQKTTIDIPDHHLRAEYWINEVNIDNGMNDTGIWLYVATDQVRFINMDSGEVVELIQVPPIVLSEIMRDVDLFVGVASVGNDPSWADGGVVPAHRDYWQSYSFGELTEVAKTRKQLLERLLPRLKISKVAEIKDKFLVVKGKLRTYKIHLGSTNILMEPNDQYLCIVPDRSNHAAASEVFLPFEGDNGFSVILSKAFLLAEDDKITDSTITRQIVMNK
jgi:hypothetical protein